MTRSTPKKTASAGDRATYLYCVVKGTAKPLRRIKSLAGAGAPRTLDVGDGYQVVVSDVPLALYSAEAIEAKLHDLEWVGAAASAHEAVVESAAARAKEQRASAKPKAPVSGTSFLLRKKETDQMRRNLTSAAKEEVDELFARLE